MTSFKPFANQSSWSRSSSNVLARKIHSLIKKGKWKKLHKVLSGLTETQDLHLASATFEKVLESCNQSIIHFLLRTNAPIDLLVDLIGDHPHLLKEVDSNGIMPLHIAAGCGLPPIITRAILLVSPECALCQDVFGRTPLIVACQSQSSGLIDGIPYTPPDLQNAVDFYRHYQIIDELLRVPIHGIAIVDTSGFNALDYIIESNGPSSVLNMLQANMAVEQRILSELENTRKRSTNLPKFVEQDRNGLEEGLQSLENNECKKKDKEISRDASFSIRLTWNTLQLTPRDQRVSKKKSAIYDRMRKIKLDCDPVEDRCSNARYRKALSSFFGGTGCEDFSDDAEGGTRREFFDDGIVQCPFDKDIPLVVDVVKCEDDNASES